MMKIELSPMEPILEIASMYFNETEIHLDVATELLASHALYDTDPLTRKHSVYLLGLSRNPEFIAVFTSALRDPEKAVRNQATLALATIGKPALSPLIVLLEDLDWRVRYRAAEALGMIRDKDATNPLIIRLTDDKDHVRYMAAKALGEIGNTEAINPLMLLLQDENPYVRRITGSVIEKLIVSA
jgi:HEAT repeat protein